MNEDDQNYDPLFDSRLDADLGGDGDEGEITPEQVEEVQKQLPPKLLDKLLERVGVIQKSKYDSDLGSANKRAEDNQRAYRTDHETFVGEIKSLRERLDALKPAEEALPDVNELKARYQETGDAEDLERWQDAREKILLNRVNKRFDEARGESAQSQQARQFEDQWKAELAKPENAGITREAYDAHFAQNGGSISLADSLLLFKAAQHPEGLDGYILDRARGIARSRLQPGARVSDTGNGKSRLPDPSKIDVSSMSDEEYEKYRQRNPGLRNR